MKLNLGVSDIPYEHDRDGKTTGDVAEILEAKYGVMQAFVDKHGDGIVSAIENSVIGAFESLVSKEPHNDLYGSGTSEVEQMFRQFLNDKEMDGFPGVPTQAALDGVNHRLKKPYVKRGPRRPYVKRGPRPSFIDTGLYQNTFRCWPDDSA